MKLPVLHILKTLLTRKCLGTKGSPEKTRTFGIPVTYILDEVVNRKAA